MSDLVSLLLIASTAAMNAVGLVAIKHALSRCGALPLAPWGALFRYLARFLRGPDALLGCVLFVAAPIGFIACLRNTDLLIAYPTFMGLSFALTVGLAVALLGERFQLRSAGGSLLILAGVVALQLEI